MEKKASHKSAMVGLTVLLILLLALLAVPTITAEDIESFEGVGFTYLHPNQCFFAISPNEGMRQDAEVSIVERPGSPYPDDVVVLLRCQADLYLYNEAVYPPAINYNGSSGGVCHVDLGGLASDSSSSWSQTVSGSGRVTLICQFKSNNGNN